jgi:hypothetical protein
MGVVSGETRGSVTSVGLDTDIKDVSESCDTDSTYVRVGDEATNEDQMNGGEVILTNSIEDSMCDKNKDDKDNDYGNDNNNCGSISSNCSNNKNDGSSSCIDDISIDIQNVSTIEGVRTAEDVRTTEDIRITECNDINIKDNDETTTARRSSRKSNDTVFFMNNAIANKPKKPKTTKDTYVSTTDRPKKDTSVSTEEPIITVSTIVTAEGSFTLGKGGVKDANKKKSFGEGRKSL